MHDHIILGKVKALDKSLLFLWPERLVFLVSHRFCLCLVDAPIDMIRRSIDRVQLERQLAGIDNIVFGAGAYEERRAVGEVIFGAIDDSFARPGLKAEELVDVIDLDADILARQKGHKDDLAVRRGEDDLTEIIVLERQLFDVREKRRLFVHCIFV